MIDYFKVMIINSLPPEVAKYHEDFCNGLGKSWIEYIRSVLIAEYQYEMMCREEDEFSEGDSDD